MNTTPIKAALAAALLSYSAISTAAVDVSRWIEDPICDLKPWKFQCDRWDAPRRCYGPDHLFPFAQPHCWPQWVIA